MTDEAEGECTWIGNDVGGRETGMRQVQLAIALRTKSKLFVPTQTFDEVCKAIEKEISVSALYS